MEVVLPRPLSEGEIAALRTLPLNVARPYELREVALILGGNMNVFGILAMLRLVKDCPHRPELLEALGNLGIDPDREFTYEDLLRVRDKPNF